MSKKFKLAMLGPQAKVYIILCYDFASMKFLGSQSITNWVNLTNELDAPIVGNCVVVGMIETMIHKVNR